MADSPLIDFAKGIYNKLQPEKRAGKKDDPAWHAKMVQEANDSFRKVAGSSKAVTEKKTTRKKLPPKRVAGKR